MTRPRNGTPSLPNESPGTTRSADAAATRRRRNGGPWATAFLAPIAILVGGFVLYPLVDTFQISLTDSSGFSRGDAVGMSNYSELVSSPSFRGALVNSIWISAVVTLVLAAAPLPLAYVIHQRIPFRRFFRAALYLPVVVPIIVSSVAWKFVLDERGLANYVLQALGLITEPVGWLSDPAIAIWTVCFVIVWRSLGIYLLIYLSSLLTVPDELFEAARVDGAGSVRTFASVVVPLMRPAIMLSLVVSFASSMKAFDEIYVLTGGGPLNSTKNVGYLIWESAFKNLEFGLASAMAVAFFVIVAVLVGGLGMIARRTT